MFFIGVFGTNSKVAPLGQLQNTACPACEGVCKLAVAKHFDYAHAFFIPLFKWNKGYLATCGCCASVFELSPRCGEELERTGQCSPAPEDLQMVKNNNQGRCPSCKTFNPPGSRFCNHCGNGL